jgi:cytochrome c5
MSEHDSTPPTTAGQFVAALVGALLPVLIVLLLIFNHVSGLQGTVKLGAVDLNAKVTPAPAPAPAVVPEPVPQAAAPAPAAPAPAVTPAAVDMDKGQTVYNSTCVACHAAGVAGAPKTGDKAAWTPRIAAGKDALYESALKGKGAMPPKGGNQSLPDAEVKAAVDYLVAQAK